jgi:septal ring factor EnvC (AmiA/AmiB activator)
MSEIQTGVTYRVCAECHLLTPVEQLQDRDVCQPCGSSDRYGAKEPGILAAHQETQRQLAEVTAERDEALANARVLAAQRDNAQQYEADVRTRLNTVAAERDALRRRVEELERKLADSEARRLHMERRT